MTIDQGWMEIRCRPGSGAGFLLVDNRGHAGFRIPGPVSAWCLDQRETFREGFGFRIYEDLRHMRGSILRLLF